MNIKTVNALGLAEIRILLSRHHRLGGNHFTDDMILAWAKDVEFQLDEGNSPCFEIQAWDSVSGHTQEFELSPEGLETIND